MDSAFLVVIAVTCVAFVSTNLDNLLALAALRASGRSGRPVVLGYWVSLIVVAVAAWGIGLADGIVSAHWVGWLGLVPIVVGTVQLVGLIRCTAAQGRTPRPRASALGVAAMFLAMSADSVAVLGPLVADTLHRFEGLVLICWVVMGGAWTRLSGWVAGHPRVAIAAERYGAWIGPVLMIAVGLYILLDTPTDVMPG